MPAVALDLDHTILTLGVSGAIGGMVMPFDVGGAGIVTTEQPFDIEAPYVGAQNFQVFDIGTMAGATTSQPFDLGEVTYVTNEQPFDIADYAPNPDVGVPQVPLVVYASTYLTQVGASGAMNITVNSGQSIVVGATIYVGGHPYQVSAIETVAPPPTVYQGFGANATGGEGYPDFHVTTLNDSGAGSIRDALSAGNRNIVFDVSGTIDLGSTILYVTNLHNFTVDGGGVIDFVGASIWVRNASSNYIFKNLRHRGGVTGLGLDNFTNAVDCHNYVYSHVSVSGAGDEGISSTKGCYDYTYQDCLFGPGLAAHNFGSLNAEYVERGTAVRNGWILKDYRNPKFAYDDDLLGTFPTNITGDVVNNVIVDCNYGVTSDFKAKVNFTYNYLKNVTNPSETINSGTHYHTGNTLVSSGTLDASVGAPYAVDAYAQITPMTPAQAAAFVKANAGCLPHDGFDQYLVARI